MSLQLLTNSFVMQESTAWYIRLMTTIIHCRSFVQSIYAQGAYCHWLGDCRLIPKWPPLETGRSLLGFVIFQKTITNKCNGMVSQKYRQGSVKNFLRTWQIDCNHGRRGEGSKGREYISDLPTVDENLKTYTYHHKV